MPKEPGPFESLNARVKTAILLDGTAVALPAQRHSLNSIRCYLEMLALARQRVLCSLKVDGRAANLALPLQHHGLFLCIEAESVALDESCVLVLQAARQQAQQARDGVEAAIPLVLINPGKVARELWWNLARQLKEPILTLSLMPDHLCHPAKNHASLKQLRKWQLEQIAVIIGEVDRTCESDDTLALSDALENRVLPWLQKLNELIFLWHETVMAGVRLRVKEGAV
jgi:hypothetical protein